MSGGSLVKEQQAARTGSYHTERIRTPRRLADTWWAEIFKAVQKKWQRTPYRLRFSAQAGW